MGWYFSSWCLWISVECAHCAAVVLIFLNLFLIFVIHSFNFVSSFFIEAM